MAYRTALRITLGLLSVSALGGLAGCVGYGTYPNVQGAYLAPNNPNAPPVDELMMLSMNWVTSRYPVKAAGPIVAGEPQFAINLPRGVRQSIYQRVAGAMQGKALPLTPENATKYPIYHIGEIRVRGRVAKVDVLRPAQELGMRPDGQPVYQCITLHIEGGFQPWRVVRFQAWEPGVVQLPEYYYCPTTEYPQDRYEEQLKENRDHSSPDEYTEPGRPIALPAEQAPPPIELTPHEPARIESTEVPLPDDSEMTPIDNK